MKLGDVLKKVGSSIIRNIIPGGGLIVDVVNEFLPSDKKLSNDASGDQVANSVQSLPPEQQIHLLNKELDVQIAEINAWTQVQGSLAEADKVGASTRPRISWAMAEIVGFVIIGFSAILLIAIYRDQATTIQALTNTWPIMLTVIATPIALLRAYFGMREREKETRYNLAVGKTSERSNFLTDIIKAFK